MIPTHGRIMLGILLVQDLSVVPMMVVMPAVGGGMEAMWVSLGIAAVKAVLFIGPCWRWATGGCPGS